MSDKDLNDICAKSCPTSSLKDFASLMGGDVFPPERENRAHKEDNLDVITVKSDKSQDSMSENLEDGPKSPEGMKKKNSFFDQLKEKFGAGESCNLICSICGHESKCLSESLRHQKTHKGVESSMGSGALFSNADLSSTRCQYCRQRCKTSSDLLAHLKNCAEANKALPDTINLDDDEGDEFTAEGEKMDFEEGDGEDEFRAEEGFEDGDGQIPHPMENKVFVWNNMANGDEDGLDDEYDCGSQSPHSDCVFGVETAPGIGAVTSKNKSALAGSGDTNPPEPPKPKPDNSMKKVNYCKIISSSANSGFKFALSSIKNSNYPVNIFNLYNHRKCVGMLNYSQNYVTENRAYARSIKVILKARTFLSNNFFLNLMYVVFCAGVQMSSLLLLGVDRVPVPCSHCRPPEQEAVRMFPMLLPF